MAFSDEANGTALKTALGGKSRWSLFQILLVFNLQEQGGALVREVVAKCSILTSARLQNSMGKACLRSEDEAMISGLRTLKGAIRVKDVLRVVISRC